MFSALGSLQPRQLLTQVNIPHNAIRKPSFCLLRSTSLGLELCSRTIDGFHVMEGPFRRDRLAFTDRGCAIR